MDEHGLTCIHCDTSPADGELGYCGYCYWALRAEIEEGLSDLQAYLEKWARFAEWCVRHEAGNVEQKPPEPRRMRVDLLGWLTGRRR
jgi:hypothetical protein